jgi:hypothetical protein
MAAGGIILDPYAYPADIFTDPAAPEAVRIKCPVCWHPFGLERSLAEHLAGLVPPTAAEKIALPCKCNVRATEVHSRIKAALKQ